MVSAMAKKPSLLLIIAAALSLIGCPDGGDGGSSNSSLASSGNVVYLADQNTDGVFELFLVSSGAKLNGPIVAGGSGVSTAFQSSSAGKRYRAAMPGVIAETMKSIGNMDFKGDVRAAFCKETGKLCGK